jgi:translocation and assembly module TamA
LQEIARFDPGDLYKRSDEMDLRRAILATGLVSSVTISRRETRPPANGEDGEVALDVELAKAPLRTIAGTIGYGTGEGVRVEGSWEHRNLFPPEGALRVRGIAGTREQLAGITFRRNNWHGRDKILTIDAYVTNIDRDAYEAHTASLLATYERVSTLLFQKPLTWSVGLEMVATDEREASLKGIDTPRTTYFVAALPLRAMIDTSDSLLDPTRGFRLGGRISPEISSQGGTQSTYARTQIDASYYQPVGETVVVAARTRVGSIFGTKLENIAPSRRFYAGGGGSVRGYGYQKIGPRDDVGEPNGGRSLVEFSLEARVKTGMFGGALSVVPFVDAGNVGHSSTPTLNNMRFGAGLGVRYNTGFGPIRVDVATPLNPGQAIAGSPSMSLLGKPSDGGPGRYAGRGCRNSPSRRD